MGASAKPCAVPPKGWWCSRAAGHEGPCAARPTKGAIEELLAEADADKARRKAEMPTERDAIVALNRAYQRLREMGWNDPIYCPKDGSTFDVIEAGSTGIHPCHYQGEWPKGSWWVSDGGDLWPSRPTLYRVTEAEIAKRTEARDRFRAPQPPVIKG